MGESSGWIIGLAVLSAAVFCAGPSHAAGEIPGLDWREAPPVPSICVAPCAKAPDIEGPFKPEEWQDACAVNGLAVWSGGSILCVPTVVYFTYDNGNAYIAYRCTKSKAGWWRAPNRFRDSEVYLANDYIEFFFSPDDPDRALVAYQFCVNAYGAIYDCRNIPAFGLKENGYNNRMDVKVEETATEIQFKIRVSAKELDKLGFQPGQKWLANFCRSWPQCGWSNRTGSFIDRPAMGLLSLDQEAPALQWLEVNDVLDGKLNVRAAIKNTDKEKRSFALAASVTGENADDRLADASQTVSLNPGERKELQLLSDKVFAGKRGHLELLCSGVEDKKVYYRQYVRFDNKQAGGAAKVAEALKADAPIPKEVAVAARYGQMAQAVEVCADIWYLRRLGQVPAKVAASVYPKNEPERVVARRELKHFQKDYAMCRLDLPPDAPFGTYVAKVEAVGADGSVSSSAQAEFNRLDLKDPSVNRPYIHRPGRILDWMDASDPHPMVMPPWTNITIDQKRPAIGVSGRIIELEQSGLPSQISAGETKMLAAPARLAAISEGRELTLKTTPADPKAKPLAVTPNIYYSEAAWDGSLACDQFTVKVHGRIEFDGFIQYKLELACGKPVQFDSLVLDIPIAEELAWRLLLPDGPMPLPKQDGLLWESKSSVDNDLVGTLVPYLWIGNRNCGLTWGADHTRGWYEKPHESLITLSREPGMLHLKVEFVNGPAKVESTTFEFALMPTPAKPKPEGWRNYAMIPAWNYFWDCGWYAYMWEKPEGKGEYVMKWDDPTKEAMEKGRAAMLAQNGHSLRLPYLNPQWTNSPHPCPWEVSDQSPMKALFDNDWANMPSRYGAYKPVASYRKWTGSLLTYYMKEWGIAGYYVDENYVAANFDINLLSGSGWFDRDGNLRGSYHVLDMREYIKQMYTISYQYGRTGRPFTLAHASSFGMSPFWTSFAGAVCFGEGGWGVRKIGESVLDAVPLENLQLYNGEAFGYIATFFGFYLPQKDLTERMKSFEETFGALTLHDIVPNDRECYRGGGSISVNEKVKLDFGIGAPDVEFIGYWYPDNPVESSLDKVKVSTFRRPNRSLLVVANTDLRNRQAASISVNGEKLGFHGGFRVSNAADGTEIKLTDGRVELAMEPREVRYLYVVSDFLTRPK